MLQVGITGGIGSGKSTVSKAFSHLGIPYFDADREAKRLLHTDHELKERIKQEFGADMYTPQGMLNKPKFASVIFNDTTVLNKVNQMIHPRVQESFLEWRERQSAPCIIMEAAILIESGFHELVDTILLVSCPEQIRINRVSRRDGVTEDQVRARMQHQLPEADKQKKADIILYNDNKQLILPQILALYQKFISGNQNT